MSQAIQEIGADQEGPAQTILEHLNELRKRATWAAAALLVCTILSFIFAEPLLELLLGPYAANAPDSQLQTLRPTEGIETFFKVALLSGAILSMPVMLYQFWLFISPGLTKSERRYVFVFIPSALILFLLGIAFAWFVLVPAAVLFLANFLPDVFKTEWTGQEYISFLVAMLFWMGVAFELPVLVYVVARIGLVSGQTMREQWRIAIVAVAVLAAAVTPSIDPVTMLLTMLPLFILYFLSILLAHLGQRQFERSMSV
jgi:sec-independent protein translocase protein TatC